MYRTFFAALLLAALPAPALGQSKQALEQARARMVEDEIIAAGVKNARVIEAMRETPRHEFVPFPQRKLAYFDMALPIGDGQTISPPFVVAYMTEQLDPQPTDKVLEIGTGSGYQAAVLSPLVKEVYTIEIVEPLGRRAARTLQSLRYTNVHTKIGDGYLGWPEHAPFDKIIVTCSPERVPKALVDQLREGGMMVVPVGERYQQTLYLLVKQQGQMKYKALLPTLFVPMTGEAEQRRQVLPDPLDPKIANGSFEELVEGSAKASGWHYQRQMELVADEKEARDGKRFAVFKNEHPGRGNHALQGFAVDGRKVSDLEIELWVRGQDIRFGESRDQWPRLIITFYDENRGQVGESSMGPWMGSFPWQRQRKRLSVPVAAREAILRIGLLGAIGEIAFDDLQMRAVTK